MSTVTPGRDPKIMAIFAMLGLLGINFICGWVAQYYLRTHVNTVLSFNAYDPSYLPHGIHLRPAIGVHYFGDFGQYIGYARSSNPYHASVPPAYGPAAIVVAKLLNFVPGWPSAVFVFLIGSLATFMVGIRWILGRGMESWIVAMLCVGTGPIIISLDRGNFETLVIALCAIFCAGILEQRNWTAVLALSGAIAVKPYVGVLLLAFVVGRQWTNIIRTAIVTLVAYLASFLIVGGSLGADIAKFFRTDLLFTSSPVKGAVLGCVSAAAAVYKTLWLFWSSPHFYRFLKHGTMLQLPGVFISLLCLAVVYFGRRRLEVVLIALLAMTQLAPVATYPYAEASMIVELCLVIRLFVAEDVPRKLLMTCGGLLTIGIAPWIFFLRGPSGNTTPMFAYVGPLANIVVVVIFLVWLVASWANGEMTESRTLPTPEYAKLTSASSQS